MTITALHMVVFQSTPPSEKGRHGADALPYAPFGFNPRPSFEKGRTGEGPVRDPWKEVSIHAPSPGEGGCLDTMGPPMTSNLLVSTTPLRKGGRRTLAGG